MSNSTQLLTDVQILSVFALISEYKLLAQALHSEGCALVGIDDGNFLAAASHNANLAKTAVLKEDFQITYGSDKGFDYETALKDYELWNSIVSIDNPDWVNQYLAEWQLAITTRQKAKKLWKAMNEAYAIPNGMFTFLIAVLKPSQMFIAHNNRNSSDLYCFEIEVNGQVIMAVAPHNRLNDKFQSMFNTEDVRSYRTAKEQAHIFQGVVPVSYDDLVVKFSALQSLVDNATESPFTEGDVEVLID